MIDLRSDTLTKPTEQMRQAMYLAEVGDDGRTTMDGKGEDPTVLALEKLAAHMSGKEAALYCASGTMANIVALYTHCKRGDAVVVGETSHLYQKEKAPFMREWGGLEAVFFQENADGFPSAKNLTATLTRSDSTLVCLENTHNFRGGSCLSVQQTRDLCHAAHEKGAKVHLDGARIFNACVYLNVPLDELVKEVDSFMFCLSKGLGAPVGSVLCGSTEFISQARRVRKLLGGAMRQAGVIAAAGIVALESSIVRLAEDHQRAYLLAAEIHKQEPQLVDLQKVQTNLVTLDLSIRNFSAQALEKRLIEKGVHVKCLSPQHIRLTTYREIEAPDVYKAAEIVIESIRELDR